MREGNEAIAQEVANEVITLGAKIKMHQDEAETLSKTRRILITKMKQELGMTHREIAAATNMSQPRVAQLLGITLPATPTPTARNAYATTPTMLTPGQQRIYNEVLSAGTRRYNGRAKRAIETLETLGLVTVDWDMELTAKGNGTQPRWRITVQPK